ncbi:SGNH hydrolase [Coemansia reversa NRRL 1564]|uniref:SGNH hydrolase n=1 Tax=Coemansia reversa (strain ATCC 12441 / NRRL 1564) TaxID=763665 RepID=A0A2G5BCT8_COERN|nr:SGNH hydrolase [Coemansia reversa NRRL 1564]|eukprot:PIA16826.1 SGNH hydrolase [Coemansia reversa NRRL 1564]
MRFQHISRHLTLLNSAAAGLSTLGIVYLYTQIFKPSSNSRTITPAAYPMYDTLLAFGDSITQVGSDPHISGFVGNLAGYYSRRMDVLNRGFSGYNTKQALAIADQVFPKTASPRRQTMSINSIIRWPHHDDTFPSTAKGPRLCLLAFGANDASLPFSQRHIPLNEFSDNLRQMVALLHDPGSVYYSPDTHILFITPPPISDRMWEKDCKLHKIKVDRKNAVTKTYADTVITVAKELDLPYVDIWSAIESAVHNNTDSTSKVADDLDGGYEKYLNDGLHLTDKGNELLFDLIVKEIHNNWPELNP